LIGARDGVFFVALLKKRGFGESVATFGPKRFCVLVSENLSIDAFERRDNRFRTR
jgi:hypothetical protein